MTDKRNWIGGSDAPVILGLSPYKTPLDLYLQFQGEEQPVSPEKEKIFARGKRFEPVIIDMVAEETGLSVTQRNHRYIDSQHSWMRAEIDCEFGEINGEIKSVNQFAAKYWADGVPAHVEAQVQHGLGVTAREVAMIAALIGTDDLRIFEIRRDEEIIKMIRQAEIDFWDRYIKPGLPPPAATVGDVKRLHPVDDGSQIMASADIVTAWSTLKTIRAEIKLLEKEDEKLTEQIQLYMGSHSDLVMDGGATLATWKAQSSSRFDQTAFKEAHPDLFEAFKKSSTSRVFRLK